MVHGRFAANGVRAWDIVVVVHFDGLGCVVLVIGGGVISSTERGSDVGLNINF